MTDVGAYREVFIAESADFLEQVTHALLALESEQMNQPAIEAAFRGAHSLKGMAGAMGYERTADLCEAMETVMEHLRSGSIAANRRIVETMLAAVDLAGALIAEEDVAGTFIDPSEMVGRLQDVCAAAARPRRGDSFGVDRDFSTGAPGGDLPVWRVRVALEPECALKAVRAYMVLKRLGEMGEVLDTVPSLRDIEDERFDDHFDVLLATGSSEEDVIASAVDVTEVARAVVSPVAPDDSDDDVSAPVPAVRQRALPQLSESRTVRISVGRLDGLVDLVGELLIVRSRFERLLAEEEGEGKDLLHQLQRACADLQYEVMRTRMVPVSNIFNRFPRMVRDLAIELGKEVDFRMEGLDVELDRAVLDEIGDSLVHLLRNCIGHGVEPPADRLKAGKPPAGRISLSAHRGGDEIVITVSDDGSGMDVERVWRSACDRGLVVGESREGYSDADIYMLACAPGFTTAEHATKISGRGVGLDAVKEKIELLGGTLRIHSGAGIGTEFVMHLPASVAILQALLVESRGERYALPLSAVERAVAVEESRVETVDGCPVLVMPDGDILPVRRLDVILHGGDAKREPEQGTDIVVMTVAEDRTALHVDEVLGRSEIVSKPLSPLLRGVKGYSGTTVTGDGRVMLILDPRCVLESWEA